MAQRIAAAVAAILCALAGTAWARAPSEQNLVLVTFDGVRWEDVFRGADPAMAADKRWVNPEMLDDMVKAPFLAPADRKRALTPFLHDVVAKEGVLIGNRDAGECARVANDMWFSYPGYNEILTGKPDPRIVENDDKPNDNVTFLEWLNKKPAFAGRVRMYGTWNLFPNIVNAKRSAVPVNEGFDRGPTDTLTWRTAREAMRQDKPRVLYIAFGDTDELAHYGDYMNYLLALERGDDVLRQIWDMIEDDPFYRGRTTLIVTTDHGRGHEPVEAWQDHSAPRYHQLNPEYQPQYNKTGVVGSENVWFAAIGPAVRRDGTSAYKGGACAQTRQLAASALSALGQDWRAFDAEAGVPFAFLPSEK